MFTHFSTTRNGPWFMIRDLLRLPGKTKRKRGERRSDSPFLPFNQMLSDCEILKFPYYGNMLSWVGKRERTTIRCYLVKP